MRRVILSSFWRLDRTYGSFSRMVALFGGLIILAMICILLKEVIFRNMGMPSATSFELVVILVIWVKLVPMAFAQMDGGMIRLTFLIDRMPPKVRPWMELLGSSGTVIFSLLLLKATWDFFEARVPGGYFTVTHWPVDLQRGMMPVFALLLTVATIICLGRSILSVVQKNSLPKTDKG